MNDPGKNNHQLEMYCGNCKAYTAIEPGEISVYTDAIEITVECVGCAGVNTIKVLVSDY